MKFAKIVEASEEAIKKFLEDNEEWLNSSPSPEEKKQKMQYLLNIASILDDKNLSTNYGDKQKLKNLKLQSKESYGWLNDLPDEEKTKELQHDELRAEFDFHKNLMKTNFQNPKSTEFKLYYSLVSKFVVKTDNIDSILNSRELELEEINEDHWGFKELPNRVGVYFFNSKGFIPENPIPNYKEFGKSKQIFSNLYKNPIKIINSTFFCKLRHCADLQVINSKLFSRHTSALSSKNIDFISDSEFINCSIKVRNFDCKYCTFNDCNISLPKAYFICRSEGRDLDINQQFFPENVLELQLFSDKAKFVYNYEDNKQKKYFSLDEFRK